MGTSCAISGTGFLLNSSVIRKGGGWKYHLLTEDIEFSVDSAITGGKIGYCKTAIIYDEQPTTFKQSWTQRLRWSKGFYQVMFKYGGALFAGIFKRHKSRFACFDMFLTIAPVFFVSLFCVGVNLSVLFDAIFTVHSPYYIQYILWATTSAIALSLMNFYLFLFLMGLITTVSEWNKIATTTSKKIFYIFSFPLFLFTYIPISIVAIFKKVKWDPIVHSVSKSLDDVR